MTCIWLALCVGCGATSSSPKTGKADSPRPFIESASLGRIRSDHQGRVGMEIKIGGSDITVTHLGRWVHEGNREAHVVNLVDAQTLKDVPHASVSIDLSKQKPGDFAYAELSSPVILRAGLRYYVVSAEELDVWADSDTAVTTASVAECISAIFFHGHDGNWQKDGGNNTSFVPVNFMYAK